MKRLLSLFFLFVFLVTGCGTPEAAPVEPEVQEPVEERIDEPSPDCTQEDFVGLEVERPVYDPSVKSFTYFIHNLTGEVLEFGEPYTIQRWENDAWKDLALKENIGWISIGYTLQPEGVMALTGSFDLYEEPLKEGTYRLVKELGGRTVYDTFEIGESMYTAETPYGFTPLETLPLACPVPDGMGEEAIFTWEGLQRPETVEEFLFKVSLGADCMLRTVQDYGENTPMVTDVIYEADHFLWRMWSDGYVTEKRYSYLVTDGTALYLSNGADWENTLKYDSEKTLLIPEGTMTELIPQVKQMSEARLASNVTRYKIWQAQENGLWSAGLSAWDGLPNGETEFFVEWHDARGGGYGSSYNLQNWDGLETAIRAIAWREDGALQLDCDTSVGGNSVLYFEPETEKLYT